MDHPPSRIRFAIVYYYAFPDRHTAERGRLDGLTATIGEVFDPSFPSNYDGKLESRQRLKWLETIGEGASNKLGYSPRHRIYPVELLIP